ncbi:MAG: dephospho-CoA kinase [Oscillospiraceae bacterium]|nr:dephospho-CoA kinase [Oscillospiraceae bacterium]
MDKRLIVAITGQSGCGKSTLSAFYASKGYKVIDCDKVAKDIRSFPECQQQLAEYFGADIIFEGQVDTKLLSMRAFATEENLQKLTDITHPFIEAEILRQAEEAFAKGDQIVFVDGAVIIGHRVEKHCNKFIVVVVEFEKQCARLMKRDNITFEQAQTRVLKQTPYSDMLKKADYVINNNTDVQSLILQGELVIRQLEAL